MSSFKKKKQSIGALSKSDIDFYKMTGVFALACIFVLLALKMQNSRIERIVSGKDLTYNFYMFCKTPLFAVISAVALIGTVAWFVVCKVKKINESKSLFTSTNCLVLVGYLVFFTLCFGIREGSTNHGFFIVATIIAATLYYISKLYNIDFVMYSVVTSFFAAAIGLWAMMFETAFVILKLVIIALGIAVCVIFNKKINSLKISKRKKETFLTFPIYIPLVFGSVFLFWAYFQNLPFFRSSEVLLSIQKLIFLNRNTMLIILFVQYIAFAIVYTIRRIKD